MSNSKTSSTTSSMNVADSPAARAAIGREKVGILSSPARLTPAAPDASGMGGAQNSQVPTSVIKRVDCTVLAGSGTTSSDSCGDVVKAAMDKIANAGGPRTQMQGQQDQRGYQESGKAFRSTPTGLDSDSGV